MFSDPLTGILLIFTALIAGIFFEMWFFRFPFTLIILIMALFVVDVVFGQFSFKVEIGQISVYLMDILSVFLILTALIRFFYKRRIQTLSILVIFLGVLLLVSFLRGLIRNGLEIALNDFRLYLYFYATLFFTISLTYSPKLLRKLVSWVGVVGWTLLAIAFIRWILVGLGMVSSLNWLSSSGSMVRVLSGAPTLFLLQTLIIYRYTRKQSWKIPYSKLIPCFFLPTILILQHRTVWVILAFTILLAIFLKRKVGLFFIVIIVISMLVITFFGWGNYSLNNLSGTVLDFKNFNWRILGWRALLNPERYKNITDYFIGQPLGTGYLRYIVGWLETSTAPHNFYVQTFLNIGGLGLVTLLAIYYFVIKSLWSKLSNEISRGFILLLVTQLVFYISYSPNYEQGIILGLAIVISDAIQRQEKNESQGSYSYNEKAKTNVFNSTS